MIYDRILIRYGEISTKGRNRSKFVERMKTSIQRAITDFPRAKVQANRERMFVVLNGENGKEIMERIKGVFGIQSLSPAVKTTWDLEEMKDTALKLFQMKYKEGETFKISARRSDKSFPLDTNEINHTFGAHILRNVPGVKVDVRNPDINLHIEIRSEAAYFSCENILGAGGLPSGSSGKAMLMLSGGIDSPVAGFLSMKRGLEIEAVHFFSPPFTSERAKEKVIGLAEKLAHYNGGFFTLHVVPFTEIQTLIHKQVPENYTMTTTRRLMLRITDLLREKSRALGIVTGESIGQVASQTIESMFAINAVTNTPIIRPLVTMDKADIIKIAQEIDTYEISQQPYEDCCTVFVPASPKTKPKKEKVEYYESFVDFEPLIEKAVEGTEIIQIQPGQKQEADFEELF